MAKNRKKPEKTGSSLSDLAKLKPKQLKAIAALKQCPTITDAARHLKVNERTLRTYLDDPVFRAGFRELLYQDLAQSVGVLSEATAEAIAALRVQITEGRGAERVAAAKAILDYSFKGVDLLHTSAQLEQVQADIDALKRGEFDREDDSDRGA